MQSTPVQTSRINYYFGAVVIIAAAIGAQIVYQSHIGNVQILFIYPALFAVSWVCGFGPSILATIIGITAIDYFFMEPFWSFGIVQVDDQYRMLTMAITTLTMAWLISKRKKTEGALHESGQQFESLANTIAQLVWVTDLQGEPEFVNERWYNYTGQVVKKGQKKNLWTEVIHPEDRDRVIHAHTEALKTKTDFMVEYRLLSHQGEYRWHLARTVFVKDSTGKFSKRFGTATDIHDQKLLTKKLEDAVRSRDEFLSIASHELKTPLTSLQLQVQLRQRDMKKEDPESPLVKKIQKSLLDEFKSIQRIARLVDDMLDVARIGAGKLVIEKVEFDLSEMVTEVVRQFQPTAESAGVVVQIGECPAGIVGKWDRFRLEQVLLNLLTNALRYGEMKPIEVHTQIVGGHASFSVQDHGIGIAPEYLDKIFNRFERIPSVMSVTGMGLGLYISKQIVQAHGGTIEVESVLGSGSRFNVQLPRSP